MGGRFFFCLSHLNRNFAKDPRKMFETDGYKIVNSAGILEPESMTVFFIFMENSEVIHCFIVFIKHLVTMLHVKNPPEAPLVSSSVTAEHLNRTQRAFMGPIEKRF